MLLLNSDVKVDSIEMLKFAYISPLNVNLVTSPFMTIIELFKFYIIMLWLELTLECPIQWFCLALVKVNMFTAKKKILD